MSLTVQANIKKAVIDILHWNHLGCFSHILNLTVRYGIQQPQIQEVIQKVKAITEYTRRCTVASTKLRKVQQQMGQAQQRLKQDVATRWNSTYCMLKRMSEACEILQSFEEVTVELSSDRYVKIV